MEKIFVNDSTLLIAKKKRAKKWMQKEKKKNRNFAVLDYRDVRADISFSFLQQALQGLPSGIIICNSVSKQINQFFSQYRIIKAAGGLVLNNQDEVLLIYRRNKWDLPKGKVDEGEKLRVTALREVQEETGLKNPEIVSSIKFSKGKQKFSYHLYMLNQEQILKATKWYVMRSSDSSVNPQEEEDISEVRWVKQKDLINYYPSMFPLVWEVLKQGLK